MHGDGGPDTIYRGGFRARGSGRTQPSRLEEKASLDFGVDNGDCDAWPDGALVCSKSRHSRRHDGQNLPVASAGLETSFLPNGRHAFLMDLSRALVCDWAFA